MLLMIPIILNQIKGFHAPKTMQYRIQNSYKSIFLGWSEWSEGFEFLFSRITIKNIMGQYKKKILLTCRYNETRGFITPFIPYMNDGWWHAFRLYIIRYLFI